MIWPVHYSPLRTFMLAVKGVSRGVVKFSERHFFCLIPLQISVVNVF